MMMHKACTLLQEMSIPLWAKRPERETRLLFLAPKMHARLLVVLEKKIPEAASEVQKVFQGMLKVLNLSPEAMSLGWCLTHDTASEHSGAQEKFQQALRYWQPQNILFLGQSFAEMGSLSQPHYFVTHHPEALVTTPQYKRAAYQILLSLKESLDRGVPNA